MTNQLNILFMAISSRLNASGEAPLYCRVLYKGRQKRFMIGCTIPLGTWDQTKQRARGKSSKAETVNQQISLLVQKIYKAEADLLKLAEPFEMEDIVGKVQGLDKAACRTLMQVYEYRYMTMQKLANIDYKPSTLRKFIQMADAVRYFLKYKYNTEDIPLSKVNLVFLQELETYLKSEKRMKMVTVNKVVQKLKSITKIAIDHRWMSANPFPGHRFKHDRLNVIYLTIDELTHLENFQFAQPRLARVRDIFLFSVYTGLHYMDAMSITYDNIIEGVDGNLWISYIRQKTGKRINIPMLNKARLLMGKFRKEGLLAYNLSTSIVPRMSNQKVNSYLKEVGAICNIDKPLTHKVARKTFGSALLYYNVPMKVVSELMGHSSVLVTERHYAQMELKKLGEAITGVDALITLQLPVVIS